MERVTTEEPPKSWTITDKCIICPHCNTFFYKDDRFPFMRFCPYCGKRLKGETQ